MCLALLQEVRFYDHLLTIDRELAARARRAPVSAVWSSDAQRALPAQTPWRCTRRWAKCIGGD